MLYPLEKACYISLERGTKKIGRGAKPFQVRLTDKMKSELIAPIIECLQSQAHPDLRPMLRKPLTEILKDKNTKVVSLDDVAKEVGLTFQLKSNVVMVVSTGNISGEARKYAQQVMSTTNLNVILLDSSDLQKIADNPTYVIDALNREARRAMEIKKLELF